MRRLIALLTSVLVVAGCTSFSKPTIKIKAGIVYQMGGPQPVARANFYLTKDDLLSISRQEGRKADIGYWEVQCDYDFQVGGKASNLDAVVTPHAVSTTTTDFEGNGSFQNLTPGKYYLIGAAQTRRGVALWNLPVTTDDQTITLDQNNAAYVSP